MFPYIRLVREILRARRMPRFQTFDEEHVSHHICLPWDIDMFGELNNGRALTLYDLGRIGMAYRSDLTQALRRERWGMTMAGSSVRYRKRVLMWDRVTVRTRTLGWDDKFVYIEQSMWKSDGDCANHALYRAAITDRNGLVRPDRVRAALGTTDASPALPGWVHSWIDAEAHRPWPPMQDAATPENSVSHA